MAYLVLAYPQLSDQDFVRIQNFRKNHDALYFNVVDPHFTLVFPIEKISKADIVDEIKEMKSGISKIEFEIAGAAIHKDELSEYYHCFLIPGKGNSAFINLHDIIYSAKLNKYLRKDIEFIPHINIGNSLNENACKKMITEWNSFNLTIQGSISRLTIASYQNSIVTNIEELELG